MATLWYKTLLASSTSSKGKDYVDVSSKLVYI